MAQAIACGRRRWARLARHRRTDTRDRPRVDGASAHGVAREPQVADLNLVRQGGSPTRVKHVCVRVGHDSVAMRILIVEDDEPSLLLAKRVVESVGHTVSAARDGLQAVSLARSEKPNMILLDLYLPGIAGLDIVRTLRADEKLREVPVIALSAGDIHDQAEAIRSGCNEFLSKPYQPEQLRAAIRRHLPG